MKTSYTAKALLVIAAVLCASCTEEMSVRSQKTVSIMAVGSELTKTQIAENQSSEDAVDIHWTPGDKIGVFGSTTSNSEFSTAITTEAANAEFTGTMGTDDSPVVAYYPYSSSITSATAATFSIAPTQQYTDLGSITANDIKVSSKITDNSGTYSMKFRNLTSLLKFDVDFSGISIEPTEKVMSIVFSTEAGRMLTGTYTANLTADACALAASSGETSLVVALSGTSVENAITAYANVNPSIKKGDVIDIAITTTSYIFTFTMTATRDYLPGYCYTIPLDMKTASEQASYTKTTGARQSLWDNGAAFSFADEAYTKATSSLTEVLLSSNTTINDSSLSNSIVFLEDGVTLTLGSSAVLSNTLIMSNNAGGSGKVASQATLSSGDVIFWDVDFSGETTVASGGSLDNLVFTECNISGASTLVNSSNTATSIEDLEILSNVFHSTSESTISDMKIVDASSNVIASNVSIRDNLFINIGGNDLVSVSEATNVSVRRNHFYYGTAYSGATTLFKTTDVPSTKVITCTSYYADGGTGSITAYDDGTNTASATATSEATLSSVNYTDGTYTRNFLIISAQSTYSGETGSWDIDHSGKTMILRHCQSDVDPDCCVMPQVTYSCEGTMPEAKTLTAVTPDGGSETYALSLSDYTTSSDIYSVTGAGSGWKTIWADEFNGSDFDSNVWTRIPVGTPDWRKGMEADNGDLVEVTGGCLVTKAEYTNDSSRGVSGYVCGGIWGRDLKGFNFGMDGVTGRLDVRVRMTDATGYWPAVWMQAYPTQAWAYGGEIDIMEHLNSEDIAYITLHWSENAAGEDKKYEAKDNSFTDRTSWHVFTVLLKNSTLYEYIDGVQYMAYEKGSKTALQWPWDTTAYYLILSSQVGGNWVGSPSGTYDDVHMDIDYVRYMVLE